MYCGLPVEPAQISTASLTSSKMRSLPRDASYIEYVLIHTSRGVLDMQRHKVGLTRLHVGSLVKIIACATEPRRSLQNPLPLAFYAIFLDFSGNDLTMPDCRIPYGGAET